MHRALTTTAHSLATPRAPITRPSTPTNTHTQQHRDYDEGKAAWGWAREAPASQKAPGGGGDAVKKLKKKVCEGTDQGVCGGEGVPVREGRGGKGSKWGCVLD